MLRFFISSYSYILIFSILVNISSCLLGLTSIPNYLCDIFSNSKLMSTFPKYNMMIIQLEKFFNEEAKIIEKNERKDLDLR